MGVGLPEDLVGMSIDLGEFDAGAAQGDPAASGYSRFENRDQINNTNCACDQKSSRRYPLSPTSQRKQDDADCKTSAKQY